MVNMAQPESEDRVSVIEEVAPEGDFLEEGPVDDASSTGEVPIDPVPAPAAEVTGTTATEQVPQPAQQPAPQIDQRTMQELQERRAAEYQNKWREKVGQQARRYEQELTNGGYMPGQARDQAKRYIQQEQKFRQQEEENARMLGTQVGQINAGLHFLEANGLVNKQAVQDLRVLLQTNSPMEMEREAQRMKRERHLTAENTRLKQGQVPPQTFDNSQGSVEASGDQNRLLDQYNAGIRNDATIKAAKRVMGL